MGVFAKIIMSHALDKHSSVMCIIPTTCSTSSP